MGNTVGITSRKKGIRQVENYFLIKGNKYFFFRERMEVERDKNPTYHWTSQKKESQK